MALVRDVYLRTLCVCVCTCARVVRVCQFEVTIIFSVYDVYVPYICHLYTGILFVCVPPSRKRV